jgi:Phenylalanyl-tRNA synthetase beta subunit
VPVYRIDVRRDVDVIEDILRIYGYNNVEINDSIKSSLSYQTPTDRSYQLENLIAEQLCGAGYHEVMNNSLTRSAYYEELQDWPVAQTVMLKNPLSMDLNGMRQTLLFGGLQNIAYNINHKNKNIRFFEFGNCYSYYAENEKDNDALSKYMEDYHLGLWISGRRVENNWATVDEDSSIYELLAAVENILIRLGIDKHKLVRQTISNDIYTQGLALMTHSGTILGTSGIVNRKILKSMDVDYEVFYAELHWSVLLAESRKTKVRFNEISRFQEVKRDLALLIDKDVAFDTIRKVAFESERSLLKRVTLFDVYEGKNLPHGKKSYAVSFYLQDDKKTLTDSQIDGIMRKIQTNLENRIGAKLR